eukprot:617448-Pelagomonas_calceolata.AAC.1
MKGVAGSRASHLRPHILLQSEQQSWVGQTRSTDGKGHGACGQWRDIAWVTRQCQLHWQQHAVKLQ